MTTSREVCLLSSKLRAVLLAYTVLDRIVVNLLPQPLLQCFIRFMTHGHKNEIPQYSVEIRIVAVPVIWFVWCTVRITTPSYMASTSNLRDRCWVVLCTVPHSNSGQIMFAQSYSVNKHLHLNRTTGVLFGTEWWLRVSWNGTFWYLPWPRGTSKDIPQNRCLTRIYRRPPQVESIDIPATGGAIKVRRISVLCEASRITTHTRELSGQSVSSSKYKLTNAPS